MTIKWKLVPFEKLELKELYAALALREKVFVVEQKLVYQDADWEDPYALHLLGKIGDDLAAYARIFLPETGMGDVRIGRIIVAPAHRGEGFGEQLMARLFREVAQQMGEADYVLTMSVQVHMCRFYEKYGFVESGEHYLEAGTPHVRMTYKPV